MAKAPAAPEALLQVRRRGDRRFGRLGSFGSWVATAAILAAGVAASAVWWAHDRPSAEVSAGSPLQLLSIAELLAGHSSDWRLARLRDNPAVMVIEFPGLAEQGAAMNRIAALLEKAGAPRDKVLDDSALARLIAAHGDSAQSFYQGHDYTDRGLARFFAMAHTQSVTLNAAELRLRRELFSAGLLHESGALAPATPLRQQALITFTAVQRDDPSTPVDEAVDEIRRASILRHEASHGRFFTDLAYREHCVRFWRDMLSAEQRENIRVFLAGIGFDRDNEDLMLNEAQALLMHTSDTRAFRADVVGMGDTELRELRARFWQALPAEVADTPQGRQAPAVLGPTR